jgi:NodT family efflux transporter outer membrane factor (OMF) lipoprotein
MRSGRTRQSGLVTRLAALVLVGAVAAACINLGPDYERPSSEVATGWQEIEDPAVSGDPPNETNWWADAFGDPVLDQLIATALDQNLTLRSAGLRVLQAQQQLAIAVGQQYPQQQLTGSIEQQRVSNNANDQFGLSENRFRSSSLGFSLAWELDMWGRFRSLVESASAQLDASVASYDGVLVSLIAQVARTYLSVRETQARLEFAQDNVKLQEKSLRIAKARFDGGLVTELDVTQAETLLYNTQAQVLSFQLSLEQLKNSLAVLLARTPQEMNWLLTAPGRTPEVPAQIALGMPQDLIRRRPDVRVAERQLAAQSAEIGYAITELYPHFSLGGTIATSTTDVGGKSLDDMLRRDSLTASALGSFEWDVFSYGRLRSNVRLQDALFQELLSGYRETVLQAQAEVEDAIVAYLSSQEQLASYSLAAAAAQRSADVATVQYREGLTDFTRVIQTLNSLRAQQDTLAATQGNVAINLVQVYKALGGGWQIRTATQPAELIPPSTKDEMLQRTGYWEELLE